MSERRLAAILSADMVGYSRLIGADEAGTLARLKACRAQVIDPAIAEHRGRIVKTMGDGLLAEFASVVDAVGCAIAVQNAMAGGDDQRIVFRIGVNLGDVVVEDGDIFGDGVNVAARLQEAAEPGGLCISGEAHRQVEGKVAAAFVDLGERKLKNIAQPVHLYGIAAAGGPRTPGAPEQEIRFCTAGDGVSLAYATIGSGPPLVKAGLERLGDHVENTHLLISFDVLFHDVRRHEDGRGLLQSGQLAQRLKNLRTAHPGHSDIQQEEVGLEFRCDSQGFGARCADGDGKPTNPLQRHLRDELDSSLVLGIQNLVQWRRQTWLLRDSADCAGKSKKNVVPTSTSEV